MLALFLCTTPSVAEQVQEPRDQTERLWDLEPSLWDAARDVIVSTRINPDSPSRASRTEATNLGNTQLIVQLWVPPNRLTLDVRKTDVWDRRVSFDAPVTIGEIRAGAFDPRSKEEGEIPLRGRFGHLVPGGGREGRWGYGAYEFPCPKPVGQIILGMADFAERPPLEAVRTCRNGVTAVELTEGEARAHVSYMTCMDQNIVAVDVKARNLHAPLFLRLYRHQDTIKQHKPDPEDPRSQRYAAEASWNGPIEPPTSGIAEECFWVRQVLPADQTFPKGFTYYIVGLIVGCKHDLKAVQGQYYLGTPARRPKDPEAAYYFDYSHYERINSAPGAAATASFAPGTEVNFTAFVTVVTSNEGEDLLSIAKQRLRDAASGGIERICSENERWFKHLCDRREDGRIFDGTSDFAKRQIPDIVTSWAEVDAWDSKPDPTRYEADGCAMAYWATVLPGTVCPVTTNSISRMRA